MVIINYSHKSSSLDVAGFLDPTPLYIISALFRKDSKIFNRYAQKQWWYKGVPETAVSKLSKTLSKVGIFLKIKLRINEKINLPQMLSLTFKTLGTAQNNVSCSLVMFRFQSYSKHNSKHYDIFPILRHLHLSPTIFKKTKKTISQITVTYI